MLWESGIGGCDDPKAAPEVDTATITAKRAWSFMGRTLPELVPHCNALSPPHRRLQEVCKFGSFRAALAWVDPTCLCLGSIYKETKTLPYHVTARANNRQEFPNGIEEFWRILRDECFFVSLIYGVEFHALVLMPNHFQMIDHKTGRPFEPFNDLL